MSKGKTCNICGKQFDGDSYHTDPSVGLCLSCFSGHIQRLVSDEQKRQRIYAEMDKHKWGCE